MCAKTAGEIEITDEMLHTGLNALACCDPDGDRASALSLDDLADVYRAMRALEPEFPAPGAQTTKSV